MQALISTSTVKFCAMDLRIASRSSWGDGVHYVNGLDEGLLERLADSLMRACPVAATHFLSDTPTADELRAEIGAAYQPIYAERAAAEASNKLAQLAMSSNSASSPFSSSLPSMRTSTFTQQPLLQALLKYAGGLQGHTLTTTFCKMAVSPSSLLQAESASQATSLSLVMRLVREIEGDGIVSVGASTIPMTAFTRSTGDALKAMFPTVSSTVSESQLLEFLSTTKKELTIAELLNSLKISSSVNTSKLTSSVQGMSSQLYELASNFKEDAGLLAALSKPASYSSDSFSPDASSDVGVLAKEILSSDTFKSTAMTA